MKNFYVSPQNNFAYVRKNKGICNLSHYSKITIYGPNSIDLINLFSIRDVKKITNNAFYTIFMKRKRFITDGFVIQVSPLKYIILTEDFTHLLKLLKKSNRKFKLVTIEATSSQYSFFSFHGEEITNNIPKPQTGSIYKLNHQNYNYFVVLGSSIHKYQILDYYINNGFTEINQEVYNIFLNSHSVITKLDRLNKSYKIQIYKAIINADNTKFKSNKTNYCIKQFETTKNFIVSRDMPIYNHERKKIGFVHNFYRIVNKKFPFILCVLNKAKHEKIAIIKSNNQEILIKECNKY